MKPHSDYTVFGPSLDADMQVSHQDKKFEWVEDSFIFEKDSGKQYSVPHSGEFIGSSLSFRRLMIFAGVLLVVCSTILARAMYLQLWQGDTLYVQAENNRERIIPIVSERGLIYDRNGELLTQNIPKFSIAIVPQDIPRDEEERRAMVQELSNITGESPEHIWELLEEFGSYSYESIAIKENIEYETALKLQVAAAHLPGIHIYRGSKREYIFPEEEVIVKNSEDILVSTSTPALSLSHVLGYQGKLNREELDELYDDGYLPSDSIGKSGVEKTYEQYLRGTYGIRRVEVNAKGKEQVVLAEEAPVPGKHVKLAIDAKMQSALEQVMLDNMQKMGKKRGAGIVMDPHTGEVLSLVNIPSFDNNDFSGGIDVETYQSYIENEDRPLFNRAVGGTYPSGSTIKLAMAAAALQEGIITPNTTFLSTGGLRVGQWFFPDWQGGGHGVTDVRWSIANSVNTFYYYIGGGYDDFEGLGVDKIQEYLKLFGMSQRLGIDIPGEAAGFVPTREWKQETKKEQWYVGDTYNLSIGQGDLLVTPLQIAAMTAAFANGGTLYQPHVVHSLIDPISKEEDVVESEVIEKQLVDPQHIQTVQLGMKDCVEKGSCRRLSLLPFSAGGKTGTAQWNSNRDNHAWFTSFAPFENPELVVTILVEEGEGGSDIGAPIAHEFLRWWGEYRGL